MSVPSLNLCSSRRKSQQVPTSMKRSIFSHPLAEISRSSYLNCQETIPTANPPQIQINSAPKIDATKVLFERKLQKLMQEAQFYEAELDSVAEDALTGQLNRLVAIRDEHCSLQKQIIDNLDAMIA